MGKRIRPATEFFGFYKATDKEVLNIFIKESKRRRVPQTNQSIYNYDKINDTFYVDNILAYKDENWLFEYPTAEYLYQTKKESFIKKLNKLTPPYKKKHFQTN